MTTPERQPDDCSSPVSTRLDWRNLIGSTMANVPVVESLPVIHKINPRLSQATRGQGRYHTQWQYYTA